MIPFVSNVLLAIVWCFVIGEVSALNLLVGFAVGYVILFFSHRLSHPSSYYRKVFQLTGFLIFVVKELIRANLKVAYDVVTPRHHMRPGIIAIPLDAETPGEIALLANLITLTPGTLSLDVSGDLKTLYVHSMYVDNADRFRRDIKQGFEKRLLTLLR